VTWVYTLPAWVFTSGVIVAMCIVATAGLLLTRHVFPRNDEFTHNDVAGSVATTAGTLLAVMLSFMVVIVWQEYDQAASTVQIEASAIADLYHLATSMPEPARASLHSTLKNYLDLTMKDEWPLMRRGLSSARAQSAAEHALFIVTRFTPQTPTQQAMQADALSLTHTFNDARRQRIFENEQTIPTLLWIMMIFVGAVTIGFTYLFYVRSLRAHVWMTIGLTAIIGAVFTVIAQFDLPFRGDVQIPPTALQRDYVIIHDEPH
jgi:hypothetical protein